MKVKNITVGQFNPIVLEISIESREEAQKLYAMFNNPYITGAYITGSPGDAIRAAIGGEYADHDVYSECLAELRRSL